MRITILLFAFLLCLTIQGQSQNTTKKEKIRALFGIMHQDSLLIKTIDGMTSSMVKHMASIFNDTAYTNHGIDPSKWTQKLIEKSMKKAKENALKLLNGDMVDIYDKYFTIEDIDAFTKFYTSKAGQKMLVQMPDITKDLMAIMTTKYQTDMQQSLTEDIQQIISEMTEQTMTRQL